jgi:putative ATP-dependent endonuclease of OLD family
LLGASTAQLYSRIGASDFRDPGQPLVVEAVLDNFNDQDKALFPDEIVVVPSTGASFLTIRLEATIDANQTLAVRRTAQGGGMRGQVSRDQFIGLGWKMIGANASARDLRDDRNASLDDILRSIDLGQEKVDFDNLVEQLQQKLADSAILDALRGQLAGQLSRALPDAIGKEDLTFVPGASVTNDVLSDVRLQVNRHGATRNLSEQSDGTRALFAIALYDLVSESANIVAIDEPEIHLHPTSQRSLARLLQDGRNQKIIATHSQDIVGAFSHESIVTVKPGGYLVQPKSGFLSNEERMVTHWWVRDKLEPLTASRIVAVEGVSDRIVLQKAAALTGRDLDRLGVSVVETGGAGDMGAILKLFGGTGFQIDMSLLIDEDAIDETAKKLGVDVSALNDYSVWVSKPDLEEEYVTALGANAVWTSVLSSGLFSANELKNCGATGSNGARIEADVAAFCRLKSNYKVRSAMVVAELLTEESARKIVSIESLLGELSAGS